MVRKRRLPLEQRYNGQMSTRRVLALFVVAAIAGCSGTLIESDPAQDGGADSGERDGAPLPDTGRPDTALPDTGGPDTALPDAGGPDTAFPDTGGPDTALPDTGPPDAGGDAGGDARADADSGDGGAPCVWNAIDPCGPGRYCSAPGCGSGVCVARGTTEIQAKTAVCGCDNVTYWNASVAAFNGMSVKASGECSPGRTCGGIAGIRCPVGASCNYRLAGSAECRISDAAGTCWVTPTACRPQVGIGPQTRACGAPLCSDECGLVKRSVRWYPDNTCPM